MSTLDPQLEQLRQVFKKYLNPFHRAMWRLGLGNWLNCWPPAIGRYMVITHTGRKTGAIYHTSVNYTVVDSDLYCIAGFGKVSDWYRNMLAHPGVEVWLPDGWWVGVAEDVSDDPRRLSIMRQLMIDTGFVAYVAGLDPRKMTDEELNTATSTYRLIRIRRAEARTGPGGPGDLAWVWPLATMILLPAALRRRKR